MSLLAAFTASAMGCLGSAIVLDAPPAAARGCLQLPADQAVAHLLARVARVGAGLGDLRIPQEVFAEFALGYLVIISVANHVNCEDALGGLRLFSDHAIVRLGALAGPFPPPPRPPPPPAVGRARLPEVAQASARVVRPVRGLLTRRTARAEGNVSCGLYNGGAYCRG